MLLADLWGLDQSTWVMIIGSTATTIGGGLSALGFSIYKSVVAILAWCEKKAEQWRADDKTRWAEKTDRDNQFLEKLEKNDDKRILVLDKIGDSLAQTAAAQQQLNIKVDGIQTDLHGVKADVTVMKDRWGWNQPDRQSSGQQPKMEPTQTR
jgi:hypothetical protein